MPLSRLGDFERVVGFASRKAPVDGNKFIAKYDSTF